MKFVVGDDSPSESNLFTDRCGAWQASTHARRRAVVGSRG